MSQAGGLNSSGGGGSGIQTINGDTGSVTGSTVKITGASTGLTTSGSGTNLSLTGTLDVANGGTGDTSFTAYSVLCGGTTSTGGLQNVSGVGSSGQVLTSNGAAALPTWQAAAAGNTTNFYAYSSGNISNVTGDGTVYQIIFDSTLVNINSGYNTGTGVFTAPFTGFYMFSYILGLFGITSSHTVGIASLSIANNSTNFSPQNYRINPFSVCDPSAGYLFVSGSAGVHLTANATIFAEIYVNNGAKVVGIYGGGPSFCSFSGALIQ